MSRESRNPFTLKFGQKPSKYISRISQTAEIINNLQDDTSAVYMITGVRGSGKTVMMSTISKELSEDPKWIILELNPNRDLLQSMAASLYDIKSVQALFIKAKLNLSVFGIGLSFEDVPPIADIEVALAKMLALIKKEGKRVLVTIDEVVNDEYMRIFTSAYQIMIRKDLPVYLLMTGLYENIYSLQNEKTLTFLYRAPKVILDPLNYTSIRTTYQKVFSLQPEAAEQMAFLVKGYPYAFQVLGYLYWEKEKNQTLEDVIPEFDQYLAEYVYDKIWSELSETDKRIIRVLSSENSMQTKDVRAEMDGMSSEKFSVYRDRLKKQGLINTSEYGKISLALPRFDAYVHTKEWDI